jgi:hypothetical protein
MRLFRRLALLTVGILFIFNLSAGTNIGDTRVTDNNGISRLTNNPSDPVYIEYKIRTDDFYAYTKEANLFQGNADPVWQVKGQVGSSINANAWPEWVSVNDVPGSQAYRNGAWLEKPTIERWSGTCLSNADNVYIRIQGFENENTDVDTYVSGTDSYYAYDSNDVHVNLSDTVNRNTWSDFVNSETGNGDYADCGSTDGFNYFKVEFDVWWNYVIPVNPQFTATNPTANSFTVNLTDFNNYRITFWNVEVSDVPDFDNIILAEGGLTDNSFEVTGLENTTTYYVRIQGANERGVGSFTSAVTTTTLPTEATNIFPGDLDSDMPRQVTVNWRYNGNGTPDGFKIYQNNIQVGENVEWIGNVLYSQKLNIADWGSTVNWKVVPYNSAGDCAAPVERSFTVMGEPANSQDVPGSVVYSEITGFTGTDPDPVILPSINLGEGEVNPVVELSFDSSVINMTAEIQVLDQPVNPLPQPWNCSAALTINLPSASSSTIVFNFAGSFVPTELVHWNGSLWEDITVSANAVFGIGEVTFNWVIMGKGIEHFAVNGGGESTLPVVLSSFTAIVMQSDNVQINWVTQSESNLTGFDIYRDNAGIIDNAVKINGSPIYATNSAIECHYSYTDRETETDMTYFYWLSSQEFDGTLRFYGPIQVEISDDDTDDLPEVGFLTKLIGNYPNPFNPTTNIQFSLKEATPVSLTIYNAKGQLVCDFGTDTYPEGNNSILWNGKDVNNRPVSSGIYFTNMKVGESTFTHKMVMMK